MLPEAGRRDTLCGLMDTQELELEGGELSSLMAADADEGVVGVYELGFHFLPTLSEEAAASEFESLKALIGEVGGSIFGERAPSLMPLAYAMDKKIETVRQTFDSAYFGWVAFEAPGASLAALSERMSAHPSVLRHLVVKTSREAVAATLADPTLDAAPLVVEPTETVEAAPEDATVEVAAPEAEVA